MEFDYHLMVVVILCSVMKSPLINQARAIKSVSIEVEYRIKSASDSFELPIITDHACADLVKQLEEVALTHDLYLNKGDQSAENSQRDLFLSIYGKWLEKYADLTNRPPTVASGQVDRYCSRFNERDLNSFGWFLDLIDPIEPRSRYKDL